MSAKTPRVRLIREWDSPTGWRGELEQPAAPCVTLQVDSPAWFAWLEQASTTSFCYPLFDARCGYYVGCMTVRKEPRNRGGRYWVAYRRCQGRVRKVYLGASSCLTHERLETVAQWFLAASQGGAPLEEWRTGIPIRKGGGQDSVA